MHKPLLSANESIIHNCTITTKVDLKQESPRARTYVMISPRRKSHVKTQLGLKKVQVVALRCEAQRAVFSRCPFKDCPRVGTYVGRPRDNFTRTVSMESYIDDSIDSKVYSPPKLYNIATQTFTRLINTITVQKRDNPTEFRNNRLGANTSKRVQWSKEIRNYIETEHFTIKNFMQGRQDSKDIPFTGGLLEEVRVES
ncbi:hypothetical protein M9H77_10968 [Catharanthus roseus]|uniref:Uncharacterized protein n=1 Tax=Catharanthus roseus TaxID=4058 RepID=A0ACC0BD71_CATRO|nr:hypothetical protein M9H77_10968 [Catharanthus roseus]